MEDGLVEVDTGAWPLVITRMPKKLSDPAMDSMFRGLDAVVNRQSKFSLIVDTTKIASFPTAVERAKIGEYMKARTFAEATYNVGNAIIIASATARAVLSAINWLRPAHTAQSFFSNYPDAIEWCCGKLTEARVPLSPALQSMRARKAFSR